MPTFRQLFVAGATEMAPMTLERRCYVIRKRAEHELGTKGPGQDGPGRETVYFPSLSGQTFVYKGMLTTPQLKAFYLDLQDDRLTSALGIVHSRFSTNTFPSWPLAHPFRRVAHNGEINTVTGNENWMRAREALIKTDIFGSQDDVEKLFPICTPGASDTARFDEVLELLHLGGRSLPHAVLMMIPEAWERNESMDPARRAFYRVPRVADGAVGRPGVDHVHRRHHRRRGARPQWPTPVADLGHRGRLGGDGFRGRRAGPGPVDGGPPDAVAAGPDVLGGYHAGPHRRRRGDQSRAGGRAPLPGVAGQGTGSARGLCRRANTCGCRTTGLSCGSWLSATPTRNSTCWWRRWLVPAPSRSDRWAPIPRSRCSRSARGCCSTTSSSCSPR